MAIKTKVELKAYFNTGDKPTEQEFTNLIDSFAHVEDIFDIGTTPISNGTAGRIMFQNSSNIVDQDSLLHWDNTNKRLGVGINSSLLARVHTKTPGALSTDLGLKVDSSTGTNLLKVQGDGYTISGNNIIIDSPGLYPAIRFTNSLGHRSDISMYYNALDFTHAGGAQSLNLSLTAMTFWDAVDLHFGTTTGSKIGYLATHKFGFWGAAPIVQPTNAVAASVLVGGGGANITATDTFDGYTLQQIVKALRNIGLLA